MWVWLSCVSGSVMTYSQGGLGLQLSQESTREGPAFQAPLQGGWQDLVP